tara:strand:- start:214 stop:333 length:120 start_codon:yes stop_codon:yes gene_type:complete
VLLVKHLPLHLPLALTVLLVKSLLQVLHVPIVLLESILL